MADTRAIRYFDHAATSWPKPPVVAESMIRAMEDAGGNPGRSAHELGLAAARTVERARSAVASLLGATDPRDIAFVPGCTEALNLVLKGGLKPGDRVIVSSVEHNAVVRPLAALAEAGIEVIRVASDEEGLIDPDAVELVLREQPARMVVCQHASNVTGAIQPVGDIADIAHEHGAVFVVDGAQSAGHLRIDLTDLGADAYAAPGHKGLLGPQGVGVLYLARGFEPQELVQGGSGGRSEDSRQPRTRPERYEAGTPNTFGIAGLGAAAEYLRAHGDEIRARERTLIRRLVDGLSDIAGIRVLGPRAGSERVPVASVVHSTREPDEIAFALDRRYGIAVRAGVHCSPWTHEAIGTAETGAVRFSVGWSTTDDDIEVALQAMAEACA
ncbi:MAG: aminotransferase class V-fold PLP-dependent enzyme [Actinobacteria bacterium]|nr:aminotransferase class V-fold PLP-dependent enzyme [Actinomycetota bacterium]